MAESLRHRLVDPVGGQRRHTLQDAKHLR